MSDHQIERLMDAGDRAERENREMFKLLRENSKLLRLLILNGQISEHSSFGKEAVRLVGKIKDLLAKICP